MDIADLADQHIEDELKQAILRCGTHAQVTTQDNSHCIECGTAIPELRRKALPNTQTCVVCAEARERHIHFRPRQTPWINAD